jgi:NAD(P)-dependent dehydrogenase (short-subunit alcohol dehydrogenase family)
MGNLLSGQTAVVTGGASGNGRSIAQLFAEHGTDVVVADVRREPREGGTSTHDLINETFDTAATFVECDVTSVSDLEGAINTARDYGGVDIMVNNAGIYRPEDFLETTEQEFRRMMDINVNGVYFGSQLAAEDMVARASGGTIINMSSVAGMRGSGNHVSYSTSKGAVRLMTYAMADRLGEEDIRVNSIHPGVVDTEMARQDLPLMGSEKEEAYRQEIPLQRFGKPEDVAGVALCLASEHMKFVNGTSIIVDGGNAGF